MKSSSDIARHSKSNPIVARCHQGHKRPSEPMALKATKMAKLDYNLCWPGFEAGVGLVGPGELRSN